MHNVLVQLYEIDHTTNITLKSVLYGIDDLVAHDNVFGVYDLAYELTNVVAR